MRCPAVNRSISILRVLMRLQSGMEERKKKGGKENEITCSFQFSP